VISAVVAMRCQRADVVFALAFPSASSSLSKDPVHPFVIPAL